ncbi:unnamed protein product [Ectocarpus sp. CCAP 1310/34]|nr:unnamed protein product [Ectocarpus sp. CCAP 1310/34]
MPRNLGAAAARPARHENVGVKTVPSVRETVETCAWLGEALTRDLQQDMESNDAQGQALREADIDLSSLRILPNRELLHSKIREALTCWDKARQNRTMMAGSDDMYLDYDIDETTVPPEPPQGVSDVQLYQYYVQRIMSAVPRAHSLKGRTTEGPIPLRICR